MKVTLNGTPQELRDVRTLRDLVADEECDGVAMAHNGEVVPRGAWTTTLVRPGDQIEIVRAVQGG